MKTKVGSPDDDPERARRYAVAIPSAIAITALFVILGGLQPPERPLAEHAPAVTVVLEHAPPTPRPTPKPTPAPTPLPVVPVAHVTIAPIVQRAAPIAPRPIGGAHAAQRLIPRVAPAKTFAAPQAVAAGNGTSAAAGNGEGTGSGDSAGAGTAGGGATVNADAPCGRVELVPFQSPDRGPTGVIFEHVQARVTFPDGHTETDDFPYRFAYADGDADPWSPQNMRKNDMEARVQPAPDGSRSRYSELIRYILDHTRFDGTTVLQECPPLR